MRKLNIICSEIGKEMYIGMNGGYKIFATVDCNDFPNFLEEIPNDANIRTPKKTSSVYKEILSTLLDDNDKTFAQKSDNITICAKEAFVNGNVLTLNLGDNSDKFGIADGGHRSLAITESKKQKMLENKLLIDKFVGIEVVVSKDVNVMQLATARNNRTKVKPDTLLDSMGDFDIVKDLLNKTKYKDSIRFNESDESNKLTGLDIIKILTQVDKSIEDGSKNQKRIYSERWNVISQNSKQQLNKYNKNLDSILYNINHQFLEKLLNVFELIESNIVEKCLYNKIYYTDDTSDSLRASVNSGQLYKGRTLAKNTVISMMFSVYDLIKVNDYGKYEFIVDIEKCIGLIMDELSKNYLELCVRNGGVVNGSGSNMERDDNFYTFNRLLSRRVLIDCKR